MHVRPHTLFGRSGDDLTLTVPITFAEAALGTTLRVPTLDGAVSLKVAAGHAVRSHAAGARSRRRRRKAATGDLLVTVEVAVPQQLTGEAREALEKYAAAQPDDPRPQITAALAARRRGGRMADPWRPSDVPEDAPVFVISVAAQLAGMHAQTLRQYDRLGLVTPGRTGGGGRRYSARDVALLREVQRLSQDEGVNLAGIKRIIELESHVDALRARVAELAAELDHAHAELVRAPVRRRRSSSGSRSRAGR